MSSSRFAPRAVTVLGTTFLLALRLTAADEAQRAAETAAPLSPTAADLTFNKWSAGINVPDPIACSVDPKGRVYVSSTARRKTTDLDIKEHPMWVPDDVGLRSIEDKAAFFRSALAPGKLRQPRGGLKDHNGDGSIDWKDLTAISERIYQLRDTDGDGIPDRITVFAEGFNTEVTGIAAGVLYHDGWVYATIAPDLWRFKDTDDDGVADVRESLVHGFGVHIAYGGHDMHGLSVGPDGRIYWSIGDKGVNVTSREGRHFFYPNEGCILRIEPDGSNFEVFAHGLRNVQEPAFDDFGDLLGVDNDADFKGEKERFVYIPEASDAGWRCNYQYMGNRTTWMRERLWEPKWDGQAAYLLPPIENSTDGPAGFIRDPGTALGEAERGMFFLNEFPTGLMRGFRVEQDGASFKRSRTELLHKGIMGIGMSWHPDGSLFMTDWAKGYPLDGRGTVVRADSASGAGSPIRKETYQLLSTGFQSRLTPALVELLGHADQRVRLGAQFELVKRRETAALLAAAVSKPAPLLGRIHAIWGYGQLLRKNDATPDDLFALLQDPDSEVRAQSVRVLSEATLSGEQARTLIPLLSDPAPRVRNLTAIALGRLRVPAAVTPLLRLAETDWEQPVLRHAAIAGLTGCATAEELAALRRHKASAVRLAGVVALRRQSSPLLAGFLHDPDPAVVTEAARAIHDGESVPAALPDLAALIETPGLSESTLFRVLNAGLRLGTVEYAGKILALALNEATPLPIREETLACLLAWKQPPRLDRVDGYARTFQTTPIVELLTENLDALLGLKDETLKQSAVEILIAYKLKAQPEQIAAIVVNETASAPLRAEALRLMAGEQRTTPAWIKALDAALRETSPAPLQQAALELLLPEHPTRVVSIAERILKKGTLLQKQHAIAQLVSCAHPEADAVLEKLGQTLLQGKTEPALQLEVLEALTERGAANPALSEMATKYATTKQGAAHEELLSGGNVALGIELVQNHLGANCLACHATGETGSTVGPNLRSIGLQKERAYLLESLLAPSATLAPGYGLTMLSLHDGTQLSGAPLGETPDTYSLQLPDGTKKAVSKASIASQTPPISIMPPMLGILKPREIRDIVAYLSGLKWVNKKPAQPAKTLGQQ
jgi:putative membrane-bound dehydrogenase-like protein